VLFAAEELLVRSLIAVHETRPLIPDLLERSATAPVLGSRHKRRLHGMTVHTLQRRTVAIIGMLCDTGLITYVLATRIMRKTAFEMTCYVTPPSVTLDSAESLIGAR